MKRAAAYARVSGIKQSETSLDTQIEEIQKFAETGGLKIKETFIDKITASGKEQRPNFEKMIEKALLGEFDFILVYKQDRFHRDNVEEHTILRALEAKNIYVLSVCERIDTTTPAGRLQRWMMSGINRFYIENLQQEINEKTTKVAEKGYFLGGYTPYGYKLKQIRDPEASRNRKVFEIDEKEAVIVRLIFSMFVEGAGYGEIAKKLNLAGHKTKNGNEFSKISIRDILINEKYSGVYIFRKGTKHNSHAERLDTIRKENMMPAIVSMDDFQKAQEKISKNKKTQTKTKASPLLSGVIFCADCGAKMSFHTRGNPARYMCSRYERKRDVKAVTISQKKAEEFVLGYIKNELLQEVDFAEMAKQFNDEKIRNDKEFQNKLDEIELEKIQCEKEIENAINAIMKGSTFAEELEKQAKGKKERLKELIIEADKIKSKGRNYITEEMIREKYEEYKNKLEGDSEAQRELVLELIERVEIHSGYIKIEPK